jgi:hypothetical protein
VRTLRDFNNYGVKRPFRHTHCRPCPQKTACPYYSMDITKQPDLVALYVKTEAADGYLRDGCVFREDINIHDTRNAVVKYSNGINMSDSPNSFMPIEGYRQARQDRGPGNTLVSGVAGGDRQCIRRPLRPAP